MNYSTLDRFQGAWLGSVIGAALAENTERSDYNKILQYRFPNWIQTRDEVAQVIIEEQPISVLPQLDRVLSQSCFDDSPDTVYHDAIDGNNNKQQSIPKADFNCCCDAIFILLPLIMLQEDNKDIKDLYKAAIQDCTTINSTEAEQEIEAWCYLTNLMLNHRFQLEEQNVSMMVKQVLGGARVRTTSLGTKLEIVSQAWERGFSLQQLADKLDRQESKEDAILTVSSAIALSFYCFISTPRNFMLSVKRATKIPNNLSVPVTVLTASISGAYNGISSISRNWLAATNNHQFQQAKKTANRLFETWSGIYNPDNLELLYNRDLLAVASPKIFQPRNSLKIISQKSSLS